MPENGFDLRAGFGYALSKRYSVFGLEDGIMRMVVLAVAFGRDWGQWRRPYHNGTSDETNLPASWAQTACYGQRRCRACFKP